MDQTPADLVADLMRASSFEEAASLTLAAALSATERGLSRHAMGSRTTLLRGMVHLRPGGGYRGLVVLERGAREASTPPEGSGLLPSATAWRWVAERRAPVSLDVLLGLLTPEGGSPVPIGSDAERADANPSATVVRLQARGTTHVYAVPLRAPGGAVVGLVSLEVSCLVATRRGFPWAEIAPQLQLIADVATPSLLALPAARAPQAQQDPLLPVVGASMRGLISVLQVFAQQEETLLISGPTGAGKSRLAAWCHARSSRAQGPFQVVDLLTVPEEMQMAELFGWKRGAFTGAVRDGQGCVARAEGGTLFIDEIDKLSLKAQSGLLQLMERRTYRVLGDPGSEARANVRFVVGTNADLQAAVSAGRFREDLYYRINVLPVRLPALSERADEVPAWAAFMAARRHRESGGSGEATLSPEAGLALGRHAWPGNLRQLDNVIRRAYAIALTELGARPDAVVLQLRHVERALAFEVSSDAPGLIPLLQRAARAYVDEAVSRAAAGAPLDLAHAEAFRGLVLAEAWRRTGDLKATFLVFGKDRLVESRNHVQTWRREVQRLAELCAALGEPMDPDLLEQSKG